MIRDLGASKLSRLPLHDLHVEFGARMAAFAGYEMPIHYAAGVLKEHLHTRAVAGLFDVSHMGQIILHPRSGSIDHVAQALERLLPSDLVGLPSGRQRYTYFTDAVGGIVDDVMLGRCDDRFVLTVNAGRKEIDQRHLLSNLANLATITKLSDHVLLALQGPRAEFVLAQVAPRLAAMRFMDIRSAVIASTDSVVSRSGYTGEDGFEISAHARDAQRLVRALLQIPDVMLVGLGARDSLRTEAGLCLYGADIDERTTPVEAALEWAIPGIRRNGGARAGRFLGADIILGQLIGGALRRRVGLRPQDGTPVRPGVLLYADDSNSALIGKVTSGGFGPSLHAPIAMGYVAKRFADPGLLIFADVRGRRRPVKVTALPFVPHRYKRN